MFDSGLMVGKLHRLKSLLLLSFLQGVNETEGVSLHRQQAPSAHSGQLKGERWGAVTPNSPATFVHTLARKSHTNLFDFFRKYLNFHDFH